MELSAKMLAKAAAMVSKETNRTMLQFIMVDKEWIQATDGHIAFRAASQLDKFEGYIKLTPKRKLPKPAETVRFVDPTKIDKDSLDGAIVLNSKKTLGRLIEWFDVELLAYRPSFPQLDRVWPTRDRYEMKDGAQVRAQKVEIDLAIMSRLTTNDTRESYIEIELGAKDRDGILIRNIEAVEPREQWEAVLMPLQP